MLSIGCDTSVVFNVASNARRTQRSALYREGGQELGCRGQHLPVQSRIRT